MGKQIIESFKILGNGAEIEGAQVDGSIFFEKELTSAEILASSVGYEILPAAPSGKYYFIEEIQIFYKFGSVDYTYTVASFKYGAAIEINLGTNIFAWGADSVLYFNNIQADITNPIEIPYNSKVLLNINDGLGAPKNGDGNIKVKIKYRVETFG